MIEWAAAGAGARRDDHPWADSTAHTAGAQQGPSRAAAATQQKRKGAQQKPSRESSRIRQGCSRNAVADPKKERSRNTQKTTTKADRKHPKKPVF